MEIVKPPDRAGRILGAMLGCAVGDALGLPYENLSARRGARLLGQPDRYRFWGSTGWVSDDTEHTWLVAESLARAPVDRDRFARELAGRLRWWLAAMPAGIGRATLRAIIKLWLGLPPDRSGVLSAGNGAAMRTVSWGRPSTNRTSWSSGSVSPRSSLIVTPKHFTAPSPLPPRPGTPARRP